MPQSARQRKATIERAIVAERVLKETRMSGRKLAKERMEEFSERFTAVAAAFQKVFWQRLQDAELDIEKWKPAERRAFKQFEHWGVLACSVFADVAKYQSPTFRAVAVVEQSAAHRRFDGNAQERLRQQLRALFPKEMPPIVASEVIETIIEDDDDMSDDVPRLVGNGKPPGEGSD